MKYKLLYFASLADRAGCAEEILESSADDLAGIYAEISVRHAFTMPAERLRVAVNGSIVGWGHHLSDGDEIVFLPPVSGG